ncbi:MAG: Hsp20/alpha crystallin family protein [Pseudonocardia sp.]
MRRESARPLDVFERFDRMFDDWLHAMPWRPVAPLAEPGWLRQQTIKVDQYRDGDTLVVRAELAGIDPERDVTLTVADGMLNIEAERRVEEKSEDKGYLRHELHYGKFVRRLQLPEAVSEENVAASYRDGILEIRVLIPAAPPVPEPRKIAIEKG